MSKIRVLPEIVANKIAAGEVVERPASVVKELVENAIDAGAHRIFVDTEAGGKRLIRVSDDGCGMSPDDALLAFERHATSKMKTAEDLLSIATLGFRGEAIPSIAAVSRVLMETRSLELPVGSQVEIAGGRMLAVKEVAATPGTTITVRDLFYNIPARRKFLKSESTELGHISSLVTHYALANPQIYFQLHSTTNEILNVAPVETYRERIFQIFGRDLLSQLIEIEGHSAELAEATGFEPGGTNESPDGLEGDPPGQRIRITGFVSLPEVHRLNRNAIYIFVNRRLVRDRLLMHAMTEAYHNLMPSAVYPAALVFIDIPFSEVDVNVHPSKIEVRFRRSALVHDLLRDTIRGGILKQKPIATFRPRDRVTPEDVAVQSAAQENLGSDPLGAELESRGMPASSMAGPPVMTRAQALPAFKLRPDVPEPENLRMRFDPSIALSAYSPVPGLSENALRGGCEGSGASGEASPFTENEIATLIDHHITPLGQIRDSFIVATDDRDLYLIDQHVAHERVLFELQLKERARGTLQGQRLLLPMIIELDPRQLSILENILPEMVHSGFDVEPFGHKTIAVKSAPAGVDASDVEALLREILDALERESQAVNIEKLQTKIAASVACHAAIKVNMKLDQDKMRWLIDELMKTDYPMSCPHGRPVIIRYTLREIERAFKRP
ncbi:MAG: DNA mismatch repair endonuclease MutL [Acidobacteriia bacterium]|nr:DNA mismatch repair endonuclease MutL [Terriglobia bacterium]